MNFLFWTFVLYRIGYEEYEYHVEQLRIVNLSTHKLGGIIRLEDQLVLSFKDMKILKTGVYFNSKEEEKMNW